MNTSNFNLSLMRSLKARVTVFTLAIFLFSIWSMAFYATQMLQEDMQKILGEQQFSTAQFVAAELDDELNDRLRALEKVADEFTPVMLLNPASLQAQLERHTVVQGMFNAGTFVTRIDGSAIADVPRSSGRIGVNYMDRAFIAAALKQGKPMVSAPLIGKRLHVPIIGMAIPIRDTRGRVIGVLVGVNNLNLPNFLDKITNSRYSKTGGYLLAAPQHNVVVTATDKSRIMQPLPLHGDSKLQDRYQRGYDGFGVDVDARGMEVLSAAQHVPVAGWYVETTLPSAEAYAPIRSMQQRMLLAAVLLSLLAGGLTWWLLRRELSPLFAAVRTLASWPDTRVPMQSLPITREDEIGELIAGFNRLLAILARREAELRTSTERLNEAQQIANIGSWNRDLVSGEVVWSEETYRLFEIDPNRNCASYEAFIDAMHPEDRDMLDRSYAESLATRMPYEIVHRLLMRDGRIKWVHKRNLLIFDATGKHLRSQGTMQDITERREIELELEHHRNRLERLVKERTEELHASMEATKRALTHLEQQKICAR